jgi:myosin-5
MRSLGWNDTKIDTVLSLCAGLLHLGQVNFDSVENEGGQEVAVISDMKGLKSAATLLGVDAEMLKTALTERILVTRGEQITIQLSPEKAVDSRDALTKTVYGALFLWIVSEVNKSIIWSHENEIKSSIGVLDIFGFECFNVNSFEQLCINFTNEALQQQFNKFIFKMEQAEYEREKIQVRFDRFKLCLQMDHNIHLIIFLSN